MNKQHKRAFINNRRKAERNLTREWEGDGKDVKPVTESHIEAGALWYVDEYHYCESVAKWSGITTRLATVFYAATSPRQRLAQNKALTLEAAMNNGEVSSLPIVEKFCENAYSLWCKGADPTEALTGRKTYNFARALQGDTEAVVVDVWMMRAAGWDTDRPTKLQYDAIEWAIRRMARKYGLAPTTVQAALWIKVRGGAN